MRVAVIAIMCVVAPIYLFAAISVQVGFMVSSMYFIYIACAGLFGIIAAAIVFYLLIVVARWINKMDDTQRKPKRVRQIVNKNWCLLALNLTFLFIVTPANLVRGIYASDLPENYHGTMNK